MDEALELGTYLPQSFANADEERYLDFLWSAFQTNYEAERFEFASLAFHLLYMSFVSFFDLADQASQTGSVCCRNGWLQE